mgnify:CR=1 FL=1
MLTKFKVYACHTVKIYKNYPLIFFSNRGRAPGAPFLDPPLVQVNIDQEVLEKKIEKTYNL